MNNEILLGIKNLTRHRLRSFLTILGIVFGVASVITMLAVAEGAAEQAFEQIRLLGSNNIILKSTKPTNQVNTPSTRSYLSIYGLMYDDALRIIETFKTVEHVIQAKIIRKQVRVAANSLELRVVGTVPKWFDLLDNKMLTGRAFNVGDISQRKNVVILTEYAARRLLANKQILGQNVRIGGEIFSVIGVFQQTQPQGDFQTLDQPTDAYIPISTFRERFGDTSTQRSAGTRSSERVELHQIIVKVKSVEQVESTANGIGTMLEYFHPTRDFQMQVPLSLLREAQASKFRFNLVLGSIAAMSLLVAGIGIMNIMLASVIERTNEIGLRKAIGARPWQITRQFLIETVVLSTIGGILGVAFGLLTPLLISWGFDMPIKITSISIGLALGVSMIIGIIFGIYPARYAAGMDPIQALKAI